MPQENRLPQILAHAKTTDGVVFQLRRDPMGVLEAPAMQSVIIGIHVGAPAKLVCRRDGRQYRGTAVHGDIDIIPPDTPSHWEMHDENDTTLFLSLPQSLLHTVARDSDLVATQIEIRNRFQIRDTELEQLCWAMKREMESGYQSGRFYLDGLALAVVSRLVARHSSVAKVTPEPKAGLRGCRLKQVLAFIEHHLADDLSLQQIAAVAGVSASHLNALFRSAMQLPLHQYVIQRRVERAKTLMAQDGLSIAQIALAAGFAHQSHMARHVRRILGVPPLALKRLLTKASPGG